VRQRNIYQDVAAVAEIIPGIGNPLLLSMSAFKGIVEALAKRTSPSEPVTNHREHVEREMSRLNGSR